MAAVATETVIAISGAVTTIATEAQHSFIQGLDQYARSMPTEQAARRSVEAG
ncbi:hypothetical protein A8926_5718 [Saccharopolyspora spinosa]|uniref:Uncharacterized protein n=1 Tax=Saccharopolyspora spinosa TaxID=60894 RepID=A0A2N3Y461_SACSN|nr:hypothetical protein A8926_5718 [Saccharopolyspora spinosa]